MYLLRAGLVLILYVSAVLPADILDGFIVDSRPDLQQAGYFAFRIAAECFKNNLFHMQQRFGKQGKGRFRQFFKKRYHRRISDIAESDDQLFVFLYGCSGECRCLDHLDKVFRRLLHLISAGQLDRLVNNFRPI